MDGFCLSQSTFFLSQGPFLWAEVGDILNIVFKNNATRPYSVHAHGVLEREAGQLQVANPGKSLVSSCMPVWAYEANFTLQLDCFLK